MTDPKKPPAGRPMLDPEFLAAFRRRRLTDAMAEVCRTRGYRATTIADICVEAGTTRNTFYTAFANKEAVFLALLAESAEEALGLVRTACAAAEAGGEDQVAAGLEALLDWVAAAPGRARALLVESGQATEPAFQLQLETTRRFVDLLRQQVPADPLRPDSIEDLLVGGVASLIGFLVIAGETERAPALRDDLVTFLRQPYLK